VGAVAEAEAAVLRELGDGDDAHVEEAVVRLRDQLADMMYSEQACGEASTDLVDGWERQLFQSGPRVNRLRCREQAQEHGIPDLPYGTTCQTVIITSASTRRVYFFQRSLQTDLQQTPSTWAGWIIS
jgi:hypothetical protein